MRIHVCLNRDDHIRFLHWHYYFQKKTNNPKATMAKAATELISFALDKLEQEYHPTALNNAMLLKTDEQGIISDVSPGWLHFFGFWRCEVIGRENLEFMAEDCREIAEHFSEQGISDGATSLEREYITKDGAVVNFKIFTTPKNVSGQALSVFELA